jgi:hypothetical protein
MSLDRSVVVFWWKYDKPPIVGVRPEPLRRACRQDERLLQVVAFAKGDPPAHRL